MMGVAQGRVCVAMVMWLVSYKKSQIISPAFTREVRDGPVDEKIRPLGMMKLVRREWISPSAECHGSYS